MTGRPVFQNQFESRCWRRLNGGGMFGRFSATRGVVQSVTSELDAREGSVGSALLVSLLEHMSEDGVSTPDAMMKVVSKARARDCMPSVTASGIALESGDVNAAAELLAMSVGSQEVRNRSLAAARIYRAGGDMANARDSAMAVIGTDPDCVEAYGILEAVDPEGGWPQRRNIQDVVCGRRPECPPGIGKIQSLYEIYYEWFRGNRDGATDMLVGSRYYIDRDPEYLLASARMSVDEKDWHSARMVYGNLLDGAPSYVRCEAAEAELASDDPVRALEILSDADLTSPRVMRDIVSAKIAIGDRREVMESLRSYLDSEWAGSDEWVWAVATLLDMGMEQEASGLLESYTDVMGSDSQSLTMRSIISMRSGEYPAAMSAANEAVRRDGDSIPARVQRARMLFLMDNVQRAESECDRILAVDPENRLALELMRDIRRAGDDKEGAVEICRRVLDANPSDTSAMVSLADALADAGDGDAASDMYGKALRTDSGAAMYITVASRLMAVGRYSDALYICRDGEKLHPGNPMIIRLRGNAEYSSGQYLKASASFAEAVGIVPDDPVLWYSKGMADESRGDMESAVECYRRALDLDPKEPEYWIAMAAVQESGGDDVSAVDSLNEAIRLDPDRSYPLIRKAVIFSRQGRRAEAIGFLDAARISDPDDIAILRERMVIQMAMGDLAGALNTYNMFPDGSADELSTVDAAECSAALGRSADALAMTGRALEVYPESVSLLKVKARLQLAAGDRRGAKSTSERLLILAPEDQETRRLAVDAEKGPEDVLSEDPMESEPELEPVEEPVSEQEAPPASKEDVDALYTIAASLADADDRKGAMRAVDRALAADPSDTRSIALKARLVLDSGDADGASFLLGSAMRENPDDPGLHFMMGRTRFAHGDSKGALQEYDTATSLGMDDADVYEAKGVALEAMGSVDRASECYSAAVSRDPDRLDLAEKLAGIMFSRRETIAAEGMLKRILRKDPYRVSAILMKAEIAQSRKDDAGIMEAYALFSKCPVPGPDSTVRMVRILEDTGHSADARALVSGKQSDEPAEDSVKRYAEKAVRRAYTTKASVTDPDVTGYLGLDPGMSAKVVAYLSEQRDYGQIVPGTDKFSEMERKSYVAVTKLGWKNLEDEPRLPLASVFVQCGYKDVDDAKEVVSYIHKAMLTDVGRRSDERLSSMSMSLPKGMSIYEIMVECEIGVYEARVVKGLIV